MAVNYCSGGTGSGISLSNSTTGVNYQLFNGAATSGGAVAGTGTTLNMGLQTATGTTYSVVATNATTGCVNNMSGTVSVGINPLPATQTVSGGGAYCAGAGGVAVGLLGSVTGFNYQLYNGASAAGSPMTGTGSALAFGNQTSAGTYTVLATDNTTGCTAAMTGSAVVSINPLPTGFSVTGGGNYCAGGSGFAVGLGNSTTGINYQLYNGAATVGSVVAGTGSAISFGVQTTAGTYTVLATNTTTACINGMTGSVAIVINPLPTIVNVTGGGNYCVGGTAPHVGLDFAASGVNYQLYNGSSTVGSPVAGAASSLDFGIQSAAGTYTVFATNATTGCTRDMAGNAVVVINPLPVAYTVTGGGAYCAGGAGQSVGLSNSETSVNYQLYNGTTATGAPVAGTTGTAITFGSQTASGTYTVRATNGTTGCINNMSGSVAVTINPLPAVFAVTGGGNYCSGGSGFGVGLSGSASGIDYQLYNGTSTVGSPVAGTGSSFSFGVFTASGTYSVRATNATTGCVNNMSGTAIIVINPLPAVFTVGGGGAYCSGGTGVGVTLSGSASGISYQLYNGAATSGSAVSGTGSSLSFGFRTSAGVYTVVATNTTTSCVRNMSGSATVIVNPLPVVSTVTGGGNFCAGGSGVTIGLTSSEPVVNYQLYSGSTAYATALPGTGTSMTFGLIADAGTYTVLGTNSSTGCIAGMSGSATIGINPAPAVFTISGGGTYCSGGSGVAIGLNGSASGINYQLYRGTSAVGSISGTGSAVTFGFQTVAGTYTVRATNATTSCTSNMTGSTTVIVNAQPVAYNMTGGGVYCAGGTGVNIGISGSNSGISYQLFNGGTAVGSPQTGSGATVDFGLQAATGTYTVLATSMLTGCIRAMTGTATIATNPLPDVFNVTGGGAFCAGTGGVGVGVSGSVSGINYQLYRGATVVGSPVAGTGSTINFGLQSIAGVYSVVATNAATGCISNMSGSASVSVNTLPNLLAVTGGGSYCNGGSGVAITMGSTETGVSYQLFRGSSISGFPVTGTGSAVSFGLMTIAGTYTVLATNTITGCTNAMTGSATVIVNALPTVFAVSGGGGYCNGGPGAAITLSGSNTSVSYGLYNGSALMSTVSGTGGVLTFPAQTTAATYSVLATNTVTGCISNMSGSAAIFVNPLPAQFAVTGGGNYCVGGTGLHIGLASSATGVNYQLYRGSSAVGTALPGTGTGLDFGVFSTAGTYSVGAVSTSGCASAMLGSVSVIVNSLPAVFNVSAGGNYCAGGTGVNMTLDGSETGVNYQLFSGSAATGLATAGTGGSLSFGSQLVGTYTVSASNPLTTCSTSMSGSAVINTNPLPTVYTVSGGGSYCSGGTGFHIFLSGSDAGISYQLFNGLTAVGTSRPGTGSSLDFGIQNTAGNYSVRATNASTGCSRTMTGIAVIAIGATPVAQTVTGGGSYCTGGAGFHVGLAASANGVNYQLYNGSSPVGTALTGTGSALDFGVMTAAGTYSVIAVNTTSLCTNAMTGSAIINVSALPAVYPVIGGGSYCAGGAGVAIYVAGSETGVNYQLYNGATAVGSPVAGTNLTIGFGMQTAGGTYTVVAVNASSLCSAGMSSSAVINVNPVPVVTTVTGGGSYCAGGAGVAVGLSGSAIGVNYQLYNGSTPSGSAMAGNGGAISFGLRTAAGTYSVAAANATTGCASDMAGNAVVIIKSTPVVYSVTGGGNYCAGGNGIDISVSNSDIGVSYQLYNGSSVTGVAIPGTGTEVSFGLRTAAGAYSVRATNAASGCVSNMADNAVIGINPLPSIYTVSGGGNYCAGGNGVGISLAGSSAGISYRLYNGSSVSGALIAGTGGTINFGLKTVAGVYTVLATDAGTGCTRNMASSAAVGINPLPEVHTLAGGGSYCSGGTGVLLNLDGSNTGITYQLYNGSTAAMSSVGGTGDAIDLGTFTAAGTYSVLAVNSVTSCSSAMTGTAVVMVNATPSVFNMTGGGNYCSGNSGVAVGLSGSAVGISYQLYRGSLAVGGAVSGSGSAINFGLQTNGTYTVLATNMATGCTRNMTGSSIVTVRSLPASYTVTGGGNYCAGGTGYNVGLNWSDAGVNYQLYNGAVASGPLTTGINGPVNFGIQASAGTYTVRATDASFGCTTGMTGSASIIVNAVPAVHAVTGGGNYCAGGAGISIGLDGSEAGISYTLYNGVDEVTAPVNGSGYALDFGAQGAAGTYTVAATDVSSGCMASMTGSAAISVNPLPAVHSVVASGSSYCAGGAGISLILDGSENGISYQLYNESATSGAAITGTGSPVNFGMRTGGGTYSVMATNTTTSCSSSMTGAPVVIVNPAPSAYAVNGGGAYCEGASGVHVGLTASNTGISYQLYNGSGMVGTAVAGSGGVVDFGLQTASGTYYVIAKDDITACMRTMPGNATVTLNALPALFNMSGGGNYCSGTAGMHIGLEGSATGIRYQLYKGTATVGSPLTGTGYILDFGVYTTAGIYNVIATNTATTCSRIMAGNAIISVNALPSVYAVAGGGNYCPGGTGVAVTINTTDTGIRYQLYRGTTSIGSPVAGTGSTVSFGLQTVAGSYSVSATNITTGCTRSMSGVSTVGISTLPTAYAVTGGGSYCAGGTGIEVSMGASASGVQYQLYRGATAVGAPVAGTGGTVSLGLQTLAGIYTVVGTNTLTTCSSNMSGSASVSITPTIIPAVSLALSTSDVVCAGTHVTFIAAPVNGGSSPVYQWKVNGTNVGFAVNSYNYIPSNGDVVSVVLTSSAACPAPATVTTSVTMTVQANQTPAVTITADPGTSVCKGSVVTFTPAPSFGGTAPTYTWWKNGISVATGGTYTVTPDNSDAVYCRMNSNYACVVTNIVSSNNIVMEVNQAVAPVVAISANPGTTITTGQNVVFTAVVNNGGPTPQYQWLVNGGPISGATSVTFSSSELFNGDSVSCVVLSSGPCGGLPSFYTVVMTVNGNVGVAQVSSDDIDVRVMPNPNKGIFSVQGSVGTTTDQQLDLEMTDMLGQVVYTGKVLAVKGNVNAKVELDNTLANGMYLLNIKTATGIKVFHVAVGH